MALLPKVPEAWDDQPTDTSPENSPPQPDSNNDFGGILADRQPPEWSLESSGLSALLHPETVAQIDFGDKGDAGSMQTPASITDKLARERRDLFPQDLNMRENNVYQVAQAGGPLTYPLRQVPTPRFTPERIPGYNTERIAVDGNMGDHLQEPIETHDAILDIAARGRQARVRKDYEFDQKHYNTPMMLDKNTQYWSAPDSFPLVGRLRAL